jgi:DNA-binding NtrC family response regulator
MPEAVIFVVDDEGLIAETLALILRQRAYRAVAFSKPQEALAAAANLKPDLLLSDYLMPEMNGLTLATELLQQYPECKVLMVSGAIGHAADHPDRGKFEFIEKPIPPNDLLKKIKALLEDNGRRKA